MTLQFEGGDLDPRAALVNRWNLLVRCVLPEMAQINHWPISLDHCFMRVCLDHALEGPWHLSVKRPAIAHLTDQQLEAAIKVADSLVAKPDKMAELNRQSIDWRKAAKLKMGIDKT